MPADMEALVRQVVRSTVDPLLMKLRQEIYGDGITFGKFIDPGKISPQTAQDIAEETIDILNSGGELVRTWNEFPVDSVGIQTGKVVMFDGTVASHADCTTADHAGKIVGIAIGPGSPDDVVRVQTYGILDFTETPGVWSFADVGTALVGTNGAVVLTLPGSPVFAQPVGVVLGTSKMLVMINPDAYMF